MSDIDDTLAAAVRALVARFAKLEVDAIRDDALLAGRKNLGFDSVRLVELLLACEDELGRALPVEEILAGPPLTVGVLVRWVASAGVAP